MTRMNHSGHVGTPESCVGLAGTVQIFAWWPKGVLRCRVFRSGQSNGFKGESPDDCERALALPRKPLTQDERDHVASSSD